MEATHPKIIEVNDRRGTAARLAEPTLLFIVMALALALRLRDLGTRSLWVDEAMSVVFSGRPLSELMGLLVTQDIHPPLYPVLLHYWISLAGNGEFAVRLPSVFFGVALIPLIYAAGKRLETLSRPDQAPWLSLPGLVAAILAATSTFYIGYSQEARSYMALTFVGLLSSYLLLRALPHSTRRPWVGYGLATIVALYTHYMAFLLLAFHLLFVALASRSYPGALKRWSLCTVAAGVAYLPWLGFSLGQIQRISDYWPGTLQLDAALRTSLLQFVAGGGVGLRGMIVPAALGIGLLVLGVLALVLGGARAHRGQSALYLILYLVVPSALLFALAYYRPKFDPRYLLVVTPAFYLILSWGIASLLGAIRPGRLPLIPRAILSFVGAATLLGVVLVSAVYGEPTRVAHVGDGNATIPEYGDYRSLVSYLESRSEPGDAVVLLMNTYHPYVYYNKLGIPWYEMEPFDDFDGAVIRLNRMVADGRKRLWFILWQKEWADPADFVMHLMETQSTEIPLDATFGGIGLRLFQLAPEQKFSYYPQVGNKTEAIFGKSLEFWGWNVSKTRAAAGEAVQFDLHWRPVKQVDADYKAVISLVDGDGHTWIRADEPMVAPTYPSSRWKVQDIVHDRHSLRLPTTLPPSSYNVQLSLYDARTLKEVPIEYWSGAGLGTSLSLGQLIVTPTAAAAPPASTPAMATWDLGSDRLEMAGTSLGRNIVRPGESVEVTVSWMATAPLSQDYSVALTLLDYQGNHHGEQVVPINKLYPSSSWKQGQRIDAKYWFPVPVSLSPDSYRVAVAPVSRPGESIDPLRFAQLDVLEVTALQGSFELPPMQHRVGAILGNRVELSGYDLDRSSLSRGQSIKLTLYWRALDTFAGNYKVFNHVIDDQNRFAGQRDSVPVADSRPTTTWRKGEVIVDQYEIPIAADAVPGSYSLKVGMYGAENGERLPVALTDGTTGIDTVVLNAIEVRP